LYRLHYALSAFIGFALFAPLGHAESLRKFEAPRKKAAASSSSSSGSNSSSSTSSSSVGAGVASAAGSVVGDACGNVCSNGAASLFSDLAQLGHEDPYFSKDSDVPVLPSFPALYIYRTPGINLPSADPSAPHTSVTPWRLVRSPSDPEESGYLRDGGDRRYAEVSLSAYKPMNVPVLAMDLGIRGYLKYLVLDASFNRFIEPVGRGKFDSLDLGRLRLGGNVLGNAIHSVELYPLLGGVMFRGPTVLTGGFDFGLEARAYPFRPLAIGVAMSAMVFPAGGPPLFDAKFDAGVSLDRFDLKLGVRLLKQEPAESYIGPTFTFLVRM
jgi:hypothetical protein